MCVAGETVMSIGGECDRRIAGPWDEEHRKWGGRDRPQGELLLISVLCVKTLHAPRDGDLKERP